MVKLFRVNQKYSPYLVHTKQGSTRVLVKLLTKKDLPLKSSSDAEGHIFRCAVIFARQNAVVLNVLRRCIPTDLLKELQSLARQLDEAFESDFKDDCAGGTFGIQLGTACKWGAQSKGPGKIRQDAALRMMFYKLSVRVGAVRKRARGLFAEASQLTTEVSDLCVPGTPATSCWYGKGSTLKHVDSNDVGLGFVVPLTNVKGWGMIASVLCICELETLQSGGARRSLVYYIDKRVLNTSFKRRSDPEIKKCDRMLQSAKRQYRLSQMRKINLKYQDKRPHVAYR
ncbi:hypothetical protein AK812_SmicGene44731 [Symbiodinium microadriaticum]|uniref:Uncharacterized protein n=1 Tax=Symbiodinium microadriaticum TaxID=2951 RepID=A0A1Q9BXR1_SYMMI|nr:hypothetical protein AK812_SmicGene44731 [Symbiodinium microadriaticum]CAE7193552.1 unnamed protein product [Symbiodinium sp. KB8]CAE7203765.1 unnamed protein product [Symbiodinium microadriaticum]